ncbi:unannotated protein [freshwater metagenome]|uniref:Unannotated protein n=1 Tax=freshwater metagenome TaxID=449393 RepID=A0A6J7E7C1_9ZZZZ
MWLIASPFIALVVEGRTLAQPDARPRDDFIVICASQVAALLVLIVGRRAWTRWAAAGSMPTGVVALVWAVAGLVASSILSVSVSFGFTEFDVPFALRAGVLCGSMIMVYGLVTSVLSLVDRRARHIAQLMVAQARVNAMSDRSSELALMQREELRGSLETVVVAELERLATVVSDVGGDESPEGLELLRRRVVLSSEAIVKIVVRETAGPLPARDAHRESAVEVHDFSPGGLAGLWLKSPVPIGLASLVAGFVGVVELLRGCAERSAVLVAMLVAVLLVASGIGTIAVFRRPALRAFLTVATYLGLLGAYVAVALTPSIGCTWRGTPPMLVTTSAFLMWAVAGISMAGEAARERAQATAELQASIARSEALTRELDAAGEAWRAQVSLVLHGVVQGRLAGMSLALAQYLDSQQGPSRVAEADLLFRVSALLDLAMSDVQGIFASPAPTPSLMRSLFELQGQWAGIIRVDWEVSIEAESRFADNPALVQAVAGIVSDAAHNASRYARATDVMCRIFVVDRVVEQICVEAIDNGLGPAAVSAVDGAHRRIEERGGVWELRAGAVEGSVLTVEVPSAARVDTRVDQLLLEIT